MAFLRTVLRLEGGGFRPPHRHAAFQLDLVKATPAPPITPSSVKVKPQSYQKRLSRPLVKEASKAQSSLVLKALASTWKPLSVPLAPGFRAHTDEFVHSQEIEDEIGLLAEEASEFLSKNHKTRMLDAFPVNDPLRAPKPSGERLLYYLDRLMLQEATSVRRWIMRNKRQKMNQHLENRWFDVYLSWSIRDYTMRLEQFGLELDSDRALNLRDGLVSRIMKVAKRLLFVDGTTYGLLVSALAELNMHKEAMHWLGYGTKKFQVPLYVYHQVLLKLPSSWDTRAVSSSDSEKVEEVMNVLRVAASGVRPVVPDAYMFELACRAFQRAGAAGAKSIFSVLQEMDHCGLEPSLGVCFYAYDAATNHLGRDDILIEIVERLTASSKPLTASSTEDYQFLNLAIQDMASSSDAVTKKVMDSAVNLIDAAVKVDFKVVDDVGALVNDFAKLVGQAQRVTETLAFYLLKLVERVGEQNILLNFHTFAVLGSMSELKQIRIYPEILCRSFSALKKQLINHQFKIILPITAHSAERVTRQGTAGSVNMVMVRLRGVVMPLVENFLEDFNLYDNLKDATYTPGSFLIKDDEEKELVEQHTRLSEVIFCFKDSVRGILHQFKSNSDLPLSALQETMKQVCILGLACKERMVNKDLHCLTALAVAAGDLTASCVFIVFEGRHCVIAFLEDAAAQLGGGAKPLSKLVEAVLHAGHHPSFGILPHLLNLSLAGEDSEHLLSVLAMIANTGVRSPINVYKTIAVKFKVSVLQTALWLSEHTRSQEDIAADKKNIDLLLSWRHVHSIIENRRTRLDDFLDENDSVLDGSDSMQSMYKKLTTKQTLSPLDVVEQERKVNESDIIDVFDVAADDEEEDSEKLSETEHQLKMEREAAIDSSEGRGEKVFKDPRKR